MTREEMTKELIDHILVTRVDDIHYGDTAFIESVFRGNPAWEPFNLLSDEELKSAYNDLEN